TARILLSLRTALPALCDFFLLFSKNTAFLREGGV
ncbi:MAG: hypothetical protein RI932_2257, partial [Pseudomonadota bacterium]